MSGSIVRIRNEEVEEADLKNLFAVEIKLLRRRQMLL